MLSSQRSSSFRCWYLGLRVASRLARRKASPRRLPTRLGANMSYGRSGRETNPDVSAAKSWAAKKKQDAADATRIVCHYEEEPGTRFASRKICMSAAQWDDRKLQDRQDVERIQLQSAGRGP